MLDFSSPFLPRKAGRMPENPKWKDAKLFLFSDLRRFWKDGRHLLPPIYITPEPSYVWGVYIYLPSLQIFGRKLSKAKLYICIINAFRHFRLGALSLHSLKTVPSAPFCAEGSCSLDC